MRNRLHDYEKELASALIETLSNHCEDSCMIDIGQCKIITSYFLLQLCTPDNSIWNHNWVFIIIVKMNQQLRWKICSNLLLPVDRWAGNSSTLRGLFWLFALMFPFSKGYHSSSWMDFVTLLFKLTFLIYFVWEWFSISFLLNFKSFYQNLGSRTISNFLQMIYGQPKTFSDWPSILQTSKHPQMLKMFSGNILFSSK